MNLSHKSPEHELTLGVENSDEAFETRKSAISDMLGDGLEAGIGRDAYHSPVTPGDAAGYIHEMAVELKGVAESTRHWFLAYLLSLVIEESSGQERNRF